MIHFKSNNILIPVDFSDTSLLAIKHAAFLAKYTKGDVHLLHVINKMYEHYAVVEAPMHIDAPEIYETAASNKLNELADSIRNEYGVSVNTIVAIGHPTKEIINAAEDVKADLIVMGTHGYSPIEELMIGSNTLKVIMKSQSPVMTMSSSAQRFGYKNILMPIDTSGHSRAKVNYTIELAKAFSAHVYALGILGRNDENERSGMEVVMTQIKKIAAEKNVSCTTEIQRDVKNRAETTIMQADKVNADLIVIMTDQDAEISGFFLGPYSQQVIHRAKVPVIAVTPEPGADDTDVNMFPGTSGF